MILNNKKGQVTPFIIMGIIILIIAVFLIFFMKPRVSTTKITTTAQIDPVRDYVEECIKEKGEEALDLVGRNGGVIEVEENPVLKELYFVNYRDSEGYFRKIDELYDVRLWCSTPHFEACARDFFEQDVEEEVLNYVDLNLDSCLDGLNKFNVNYNLALKELDIAVGKYNMIITLDLPISLKEGEVKMQRFSYTFNVPLGRLLEVADQLIDRGEVVIPLGVVPLNDLTKEDGPFSDLNTIKRWAEDDGEVYVLQLKDSSLADINYKFQFAVKGWVL